MHASLIVEISTADGEDALTARDGLVREKALTSIWTHAVTIDLMRQRYRASWLAPDNPFLTLEQKASLDENGLIRVGALLKPGDVLASIVREALPRTDRTNANGMVWVEDDSRDATHGWGGATVVKIEVQEKEEPGRNLPDGVYRRIVVELRREDQLGIGDLLVVDQKSLGVVGRFAADSVMRLTEQGRRVDLLVPRSIGERLGYQAGARLDLAVAKAPARAADVCQARATLEGAYSLITKQPLAKISCPGQKVSAGQIRWLLARGFRANVAELTSLKSDDVANRPAMQRLQQEAVNPRNVPAPAAPESLLLLRHYLMALGLVVDLNDAGGAVAMTMRPASEQEILGWSSGQVRRPETLQYQTLQEVEGGLFCPRIFGSPQSMRRRRFGHLHLPCPIVPFLWRVGAPSALEQILELPAEVLEKIVRSEVWVRPAASGWETAAGDMKALPGPDCVTGGAAIEAMLKTAPSNRLPAGLIGQPQSLVTRIIPVLPVDVRPLVLLDNGNFATADVNDFYLLLVNRANRLAKLEELNAPAIIRHAERREVQRAADVLQANCLVPEAQAVFSDIKPGRRLVDCLDLVRGLIRRQCTKNVEWCGRARAVPMAAISEKHCLIPKSVFMTLHLDTNQPVLLTTDDAPDGAFVALLPRSHEELVIGLPTAAFMQLGLERVNIEAYDLLSQVFNRTPPLVDPICTIHRPLGESASAEAQQLQQRDPGPRFEVPKEDGWTTGGEMADMAKALAQSALERTTVVLNSARNLLIGGPGPTEFADDYPAREGKVLEVARPPKAEPLRGNALRVRLRAILESSKRKACVFRLTRAQGELHLGQGRVGGSPDLPANVAWPMSRHGPLPFLAQLPVDSAREAGAMPIEAAPGSLLTMFACADQQNCSPPGPVFLCHPDDDLKRRSPAAGVDSYPPCTVAAEIVEETPSWGEAVEIFKAELGRIAPKELQAFRDEEWKNWPEPHNAIKIGGWPTWIQAPIVGAPLVAQIVSEDVAGLNFVDSGTIYICAPTPGMLMSVMQFN